METDYSVGKWAEQLQFTCNLCAFDTLAGEAVMLRHLVEVHGSEAALDALFPAEGQDLSGETVVVQPAQQKPGELSDIPEGDPADGVYEIEIEEVGDGTNSIK